MDISHVLQCPISLALLQNPGILPCGHTFESSLLDEMQKQKRGASSNCPLCRQPFSRYFPNIIVKQLLERNGAFTVPRVQKQESVVENKKRSRIFHFSDGKRYEGDFLDGKFHGKGIYTIPDGGRFEGDFVDGKIHGKGIRHFPDGKRYEGDFVQGKIDGKGIIRFPDGGRFEGDFVDGKFHGKGIYNFPDGKRYEGFFENGKLTGKGMLNFPNGGRYEGDFLDGKMHGKGIRVFPNGTRYDGYFEEGFCVRNINMLSRKKQKCIS